MSSLSELLSSLIEASKRKEKAYSECEYDRDYFCHREIENEKLAANALEEHITNLIDARINEAIIKHFAITLP